MSEREIKVTKCDEQFNCEFDDRVSIEFTPSELLNMKEVFKERAIDASDYDRQGRERVACEVFTRAREMWEKAREEKKK